MSLNMHESKSKDRLTLFKLRDSSSYSRWKNLLGDYFFMKIKLTNIDKLTSADTFDPDFFKSEFEDDYKAASKDSSHNNQHVFKDVPFLKKCNDQALSTGKGFHEWLYPLFFDVRAALGDTIQEQTSGVTRGDLVGLLSGIKLAVHQHEIYDPDDLEVEYTKATMETIGKNDLMTFTSVLTSYMRRLDAAGVPVSDKKAQRVLLNGLQQDIFESFISMADRMPYGNYTDLQKALEKAAAHPRMLEKLAALKPGVSQSMLVNTNRLTADNNRLTADNRLDKIEAILVSLHKSSIGKPKQKNACHRWAQQGQCGHGDHCRFSHDGPRATTPLTSSSPPPFTGAIWCEHHKMWGGHPPAECSLRRPAGQPGQHVNTTTAGSSTDTINGYSFCFANRFVMSAHVLSMRGAPKVDMWVVDGASTTFATYDRARCTNIRPCSVAIFGPNTEDNNFVCTEIGDCRIATYNSETGKFGSLLATDVLISENFPFHIFSEILAFEKLCTATTSLGSWQFFSPDKHPLFHASQRLLQGAGNDIKLYFIDDAPRHVSICALSAHEDAFQSPNSSKSKSLRVIEPAGAKDKSHGAAGENETSDGANAGAGAGAARAVVSRPIPLKVNTAKNLQMLLELHCAHDHWNFEAIAARPPPRLCAGRASWPSHARLPTTRLVHARARGSLRASRLTPR